MARLFKQKCFKCRKNYVLVTWKNRFPMCYDCQKPEMQGNIKDAKMRKMFEIPEQFYRDNAFLRSIKINYIKFGKLSPLQIDMFKKSVEKMKTGGELKQPELEEETPEERIAKYVRK
ncbi:hypothetical protein J4227_07620 [Candidatus Woesearchaeota archaeon]|nr:hypothetical protein [Candidatus Woesearchaeota archaeon]